MMPQRNMHPFSACSNSVLSPNNSRGGGEQERFVLGIYLVGHTRGAGRANNHFYCSVEVAFVVVYYWSSYY